jgi:hypothetical protein
MTRDQEIRHECLLQLYGSKELPLTPDHIRKVARRQGFDYFETEIKSNLFFLTGQKFAEQLQDPATGVIKYRITSAGMLHYESSNL